MKGGDPLFPRLDVDQVLDELARENEERESSPAQEAKGAQGQPKAEPRRQKTKQGVTTD